MKKSDLKLLRERNQKAVNPSASKKADASDELAGLFDDGTKLVGAPSIDMRGTQSTKSTHSTQTAQSPTPVAPARDFQKVANSISRVAVPAGLFKGKSKQIYDFLYAKTRGAIMPTRSVRLTRREIMAGSHIGSTKTLYLNLVHLRAVGLIEAQEIIGPHGGNEYTVNLPEEIATQGTLSTQSTSSNSSPKVLGVLRVESTQSTHSPSVDKTTTSSEPKTSYKTSEQKIDDEAFAALVELLKQATTNLTGKLPTVAERDRWREFGELIVAELQIAAARTGQVSNVPAFLTEHLRRRLWKKDKAQLEQESREATSVTESKQAVDASKCPDCGGSGWFYPDGQDRGVAKCRHAQLSNLKS